MSSLKVSAQLEFEKVEQGKSHTAHLLLTLEGKKIDIERKPLALSAVIDRSGSMSEPAKLGYAKKTLEKLVENLTSQDTLGCVAFSTTVETIWEPMKMTPENKELAKRLIAQFNPLDSTNLSGGMLEGFKQLGHMTGDLVRVFLLTDGHANAGVADREGLVKLVDGRPEKVTLTTFGYGADHDPELLQLMAKHGKGNFYFIKTPDQAPGFFGRELGGLLSCVAQAIKVKLETKPDVKILEVLSDFDVVGADDKNKATIQVDDVYSEEKRKILLKLELPALAKGERPFKLGDVTVDFQDIQAGIAAQETAKVEVEYVKAEDAQKESAKEIKEELARIQAAEAQEKAIELANAGNFQGAQAQIMMSLSALRGVGTVQSMAMAHDLEKNVMPQLEASTYHAGGQSYMSSNKGAYRSGRGQTIGSSKLFSTASQEDMAAVFEQGEMSGPIDAVTPPASKPFIGTPKPPMLANNPKQDTSLTKKRKRRS